MAPKKAPKAAKAPALKAPEPVKQTAASKEADKVEAAKKPHVFRLDQGESLP